MLTFDKQEPLHFWQVCWKIDSNIIKYTDYFSSNRKLKNPWLRCWVGLQRLRRLVYIVSTWIMLSRSALLSLSIWRVVLCCVVTDTNNTLKSDFSNQSFWTETHLQKSHFKSPPDVAWIRFAKIISHVIFFVCFFHIQINRFRKAFWAMPFTLIAVIMKDIFISVSVKIHWLRFVTFIFFQFTWRVKQRTANTLTECHTVNRL